MADGAANFTIVFTALDKASATVNKITANIGHLGGRLSGFMAPVKTDLVNFANSTGWTNVADRVEGIGQKFSGIRDQLGALGGPLSMLGGGLAAGGLIEMAKNASEYGARIYDASIKTGLAAAEIQHLHYAAELDDVPLGQMDKALEHLNYTIGQAASGHNKQALTMFQHLGINLRDNNGHLRTGATIFADLSEAVQKNTNATIRANIVGTAFGERMGPQLTPILVRGRQHLREVSDEVDRLRGRMTDAAAKSAKEAQESWTKLSAATSGLAVAIGAKLVPVLLPLVQGLTAWISTNRGLASTFAIVGGGLAALALIAGPVWGMLGLMGSVALATGKSFIWLGVEAFPSLLLSMATMTETAFPALSAAFLGLGAAIEATPIGWILTGIALVAGAVYLLYRNWGPVSSFFGGLWSSIGAVFVWARNFVAGIWDYAWQPIAAAWAPLGKFFGGLWSSIGAVFVWARNFVAGIWDYAWQPIAAAWAPLGKFFGGLWSSIGAVFVWARNFVAGIWDYAWQPIAAAWAPLGKFFGGLWSSIGAVFVWARNFVAGIWDYAWQPIAAAWAPLGKFFGGLWSSITAIFTAAWNVLKPIIDTVVGGAKLLLEHTGLLGAAEDVGNVATTVTHTVINKVVTVANTVGTAAEAIEQHGAQIEAPAGSSAPAKVAGSMAQRMAAAMKYFQSQGWSAAQAAGITGNLSWEGGLNPNSSGDNGAAHGIAQWHKDRAAQFAKVMHKSLIGSSLADQLAFVNYELTSGSEKGAGALLQKASSAAAATGIINRFYERPANPEGSQAQRTALAQRALVSTPLIDTRLAAAGPAAPQHGKVDVKVQLAGLPKGSKTSAAAKGGAVASLDVGRSFDYI